jgi:hypothetical protein
VPCLVVACLTSANVVSHDSSLRCVSPSGSFHLASSAKLQIQANNETTSAQIIQSGVCRYIMSASFTLETQLHSNLVRPSIYPFLGYLGYVGGAMISLVNKNSKFVHTTTHCVMRYEPPRLNKFSVTAVAPDRIRRATISS